MSMCVLLACLRPSGRYSEASPGSTVNVLVILLDLFSLHLLLVSKFVTEKSNTWAEEQELCCHFTVDCRALLVNCTARLVFSFFQKPFGKAELIYWCRYSVSNVEASALPCWVYWRTHTCTNKPWDWGVLNVVVVSWEQVIFAVAEDCPKFPLLT